MGSLPIACNVAPVFLDTAKTVQKTISLIQEAARNRADLVVFPETHIPAFPLWSGVAAPIDNHHFFGKLAQESLLINGREIRTLQQACAQAGIFAHIGFNERSASSVGCLWNASVLISDEGKIVNHHRKLAPTFFEKLTWAPGDGAGLKVVDTPRLGKVGSLICGENTNPLARWTLMAQGEQLHVSTWPAVWPTRRLAGGGKQYDNVAANRTRTAAHCFEAKCFAVLCSGYMDKEMRGTSNAYWFYDLRLRLTIHRGHCQARALGSRDSRLSHTRRIALPRSYWCANRRSNPRRRRDCLCRNGPQRVR